MVDQNVTLSPTLQAALAEHELRQRPLGDGVMPDVLDRFNWGAFFFPPLWMLRYGLWRLLVPLMLSYALARSTAASALLRVEQATLASVLDYALLLGALWLGVNGNRLAWAAGARRIRRDSWNVIVGQVLDGRLWWVIFGTMVTCFNVYAFGAALIPQVRLDEAAYPALSLSSVVVAIYLARDRGWLWSKLDLAEPS